MAGCQGAWGGDLSGLGRGRGSRKKEASPGRQGSRVTSDAGSAAAGLGAWRRVPVALGVRRDPASPTAPVVTQLEAGHFFDASISKQHLFASVHDAVLFARQHLRSGPASPVLVSGPPAAELCLLTARPHPDPALGVQPSRCLWPRGPRFPSLLP